MSETKHNETDRTGLDIIIPVFNEGGNIIEVLTTLRDHVITPFQVFICYDHDDDDTLPPIKTWTPYRDGSMRIHFVKNPGRGPCRAVREGLTAGTGGMVLVFPADDTFNAPMIDEMVKQMHDGCEIVCASRFIRGGCMKGCPWLKNVLVRSASFSLHVLARLPVHDATSGFRLFSRRLLNTVAIESTEGFTYSLELLVKCHRLGWKLGEVPAQWHERTKGASRFKVLTWLGPYLQWYSYAFCTTWLRLGPDRVLRHGMQDKTTNNQE